MKKQTKTYNFSISKIEEKNEETTIYLNMDFVPASRPRVTRFGSYIAEPYNTFKKQFFAFSKENLTKYGKKYLNEPLSIDISFYREIPKSYTKKKRQLVLEQGSIIKPDIDNYFKSILDSMNGIFYTDDSYVVELSGRKLYTEQNSNIVLKIQKFNNKVLFHEK